MGFWSQPQQTLVRRAIFQIHLWTGIAIGIYIILISVTGSVVVFRRDLSQWKLGNVPAAEAVGQRMTEEDIRELALRKYPGWEITGVGIPRRRLSPAEVTLVKDGQTIGHRFNPYNGAYMGEVYPTSIRVMEWLVCISAVTVEWGSASPM